MKLLLDDHRLHSLLYLSAQTVAAASSLNLANNQCTFTLLISLQKVPFCCSIDSKVAALAKEPPLFFKCRWLREDHLSWPPYRLCTFCTGRWWRRLIDGLGEHFQAVPKNWCRKSPSCFPSPCWSGCTDRHSRLQGDGSIFCSSHL